jgi:hypothetical protein
LSAVRSPARIGAARPARRARTRPGSTRSPFGGRRRDLDRRVEQAESRERHVEPGDHAGPARDEDAARPCAARQDRVGGQVPGAPEVLGERRAQQRLVE